MPALAVMSLCHGCGSLPPGSAHHCSIAMFSQPGGGNIRVILGLNWDNENTMETTT